jgi:hypothetical protein
VEFEELLFLLDQKRKNVYFLAEVFLAVVFFFGAVVFLVAAAFFFGADLVFLVV